MHERYLLAALDQAWLGRGSCAPNPSVGAVAVRNNEIIAQAWHTGSGKPHAEQELLAILPQNLDDVTLYVTLEPCNHWGKTPPCVDLIIAYGIKRVVYGYADPNPIVRAGCSAERLRAQGIEVIHHALEPINAFYQSYQHWTTTKMPFVTVKIAQTLDGKIAGANNARVTISNSRCAAFTHAQRLYSDVILTTAATINNDDPLLNVRLPNVTTAKPLAVIDRHNNLNPKAKALTVATTCHIFTGQLDLQHILQSLGEIGYHDVLVEAGSKLFNALHKANLVQRTYIYIAPTILGHEALSLYTNNFFNTPADIKWLPVEDNMILSLDWQSISEYTA